MTLFISILVFFLMLLARFGLVVLAGCTLAVVVWGALRLAALAARSAIRWVRAGSGRGLVLVVLSFGALALAGELKLPEDKALPQGKDSPGAVTFLHGPHVKKSNPDCTVCHPRLFKITQAAATADGRPITYDGLKKGERCGTCHNDTVVFGLDDCEMCHSSGQE